AALAGAGVAGAPAAARARPGAGGAAAPGPCAAPGSASVAGPGHGARPCAQGGLVREPTKVSRPRRVEGSRPDRTERYELRTREQEARMVERLALLSCAMAKEQAPALLEMLAAPHRGRAAEYLRQVAVLDSASRQGRLSREFGERKDAPERLRKL